MGRFRRGAAFSRLVTVTLCLFGLLDSVAGANHVVGEKFVIGGLWTNDPGPDKRNMTLVEQYELWAKSVKISVGDTLEFIYGDSHTVVLVPTQEMYDSCNYDTYKDVTSPSPPTIYTVNDVQPLYFLCSIDKHCADGQKVAITDIYPAGSPTPSSISSPIPPPLNGGLSVRSVSRLGSYFLGASVVLQLLVFS